MAKAKRGLDAAVERKLVAAIQEEDLGALKEILRQGIEVDAPLGSANRSTALELARRCRNDEIAVALLETGADWRKGKLNLYWAVYIEHEKAVRILIERGADVNFKGRMGSSPLPLAAGRGLLEIMRMLIEAGADVNTGALGGAVMANKTEAALMLLEAGAKLPAENQLLCWAAHRKNGELARALIKAGANLSQRAEIREFDEEKSEHKVFHTFATPPIIASADGAKEIALQLIEAGADLYAVDEAGATALDWAKRNGHEEIARLLEEAMAKRPREIDPSTELLFAAEKGDLEAVRRLLGAGGNANVRDVRPKLKGFTPLMLAARAGHAAAAKALLEGGANAELKDDTESGEDSGFSFVYNEFGADGAVEAGMQMHRTALHWAADRGHEETVRVLLEHGAAADALDRAGMTPLLLGARVGAMGIVRELLAAGADVNVVGRKKITPLLAASRRGHGPVVEALLGAGAKVEMKDSEGNTPLLAAAGKGQAEVVEKLLAGGASIAAVNRDKENALFLAVGPYFYEERLRKGQGLVVEFKVPVEQVARTVKLLLAAGADPHAKNKRGQSALEWARFLLRKTDAYKQLIELMENAPGAPAALPPPPRKPKAKPAAKKVDEKPIERPSFEKAAAGKEFQKALAELEELCGSKRQPMTEVHGGYSFHVHSSKAEGFDLLKTQNEFLARGCFIFSTEHEGAGQIVALPTSDQLDAVLAMQTNGQNVDLMPADVVAWMRKLEEEQPLRITNAGFDFVGGKFLTKLNKPSALARRMYALCPDIVDQGTGDVKMLAEELKRSGRFFFWWD